MVRVSVMVRVNRIRVTDGVRVKNACLCLRLAEIADRLHGNNVM
jgi:hypothetical protein